MLAQQIFCFSARVFPEHEHNKQHGNTTATGSSQGYVTKGRSSRQISGTPPSGISNKTMMSRPGLPDPSRLMILLRRCFSPRARISRIFLDEHCLSRATDSVVSPLMTVRNRTSLCSSVSSRSPSSSSLRTYMKVLSSDPSGNALPGRTSEYRHKSRCALPPAETLPDYKT